MRRLALGIALMGMALAAAGPAWAGERREAGEPPVRAVAASPAMGAVDLQDRSGYNPEYLFALTRGVAYSTLATPVKPLAFLVTIPIDVALLPVALIGGFFG